MITSSRGFAIGKPAVSISSTNFRKMNFIRTHKSPGDKLFDGRTTRNYEYKTNVKLYSFKTGREIYVQVDNLRQDHSRVLISQEAALSLGLVVPTDASLEEHRRVRQQAAQIEQQDRRAP
eukprot:TRINITY_DN226_c0_g3_i2.p1 TRINITY_DN226_c0_g3~~TRINITY_DN226_c0_g3_i2.p1  ORF type:complete len:120 (-),score=10.40 TRINITY_DN226_c0_g3_i2:59-418(-)